MLSFLLPVIVRGRVCHNGNSHFLNLLQCARINAPKCLYVSIYKYHWLHLRMNTVNEKIIYVHVKLQCFLGDLTGFYFQAHLTGFYSIQPMTHDAVRLVKCDWLNCIELT